MSEASVVDGQGAIASAPTSSSALLTSAPQAAAPTSPQAPAPAAIAPAAIAPAPAVPWLGEADELTVGYVQNKAWDTPAKVVDSYRNLEKLLGADKAGNAVILPKPDATPQERDAFFNRLGRPADPTGYKIDVPEGMDTNFAKAAAAKFHELGITKEQGEALAKWNNEQASGLQVQTQEARAQAFQADDAALRSDWGMAYSQNLAHAQAAVRGLGIDNKTIDGLAATIGHKATMELFQKIGSKTGESAFETGTSAPRFGDVAMTPGQAKAQIKELMSDKAFTAKYVGKDAAAVAQMANLHKYAYPEQGNE